MLQGTGIIREIQDFGFNKSKKHRRCEYRKFIDMRIKASEIPISLHADQSQDISISIDDLNFTKTIKHVSYRRWHYGF